MRWRRVCHAQRRCSLGKAVSCNSRVQSVHGWWRGARGGTHGAGPRGRLGEARGSAVGRGALSARRDVLTVVHGRWPGVPGSRGWGRPVVTRPRPPARARLAHRVKAKYMRLTMVKLSRVMVCGR